MEEPGLRFVRGKDLRGWLRRQGGVMRGWQRKFFVLKDKILFCFAREDDPRPTNNYLLDDYRPAELPLSPDDTDKFMFELVPDSEKNHVESVTLCAASEAERKEWMKGLVHNKYADKGGAIFGLPLVEAMKYEHQHGRTIPYIVEACVEHLKSFAMDAEGIFRLAGRAGLLRELRGQFETGQRPSLETIDVHTVGALLKAYLRELPESLIPPELYQRTMNCAMRYAEAACEEKKAKEVCLMSDLLKNEIPLDNYATLAYICDFLSCLAANSDKTKMDARNLALVFGPNLIRHMDNSPELLMLTADLTQHLAFMLIHHFHEILQPHPKLRSHGSGGPAARPKALDDVAVGDLLRLSQPVDVNDPSLLLPVAMRELQGLDFSNGKDDVFTAGSQESPCSPESPFSFHSDHFRDSTKRSQAEPGEGSTSSDSSSRANTLERGLNLSGIGAEAKPVPPKRTKSRTLKRRPNGGSISPTVDPEDVQKALCSASHPLMCPPEPISETQPENSGGSKEPPPVSPKPFKGKEPLKGKVSSYLVVDDSGNVNGEIDSKGNTVCGIADQTDKVCAGREDPLPQAGSQDAAKLLPSRSVLETQLVAVKSELVRNKTRSDELINALKSQLTDMRGKYEASISTMKKQHKMQVMDLTAKLDAERNARAEAVDKTVTLQAQLYKYKLQYGELQD